MSNMDPIAASHVESPSTRSGSLLVPAGQLVLAAIGIYVAVESLSLGLWTTLGPGPGLLPLILGVALTGLTVIWAVQALMARRRETAEPTAAIAVAERDEVVEDAGTVEAILLPDPSEDKLDRPYALGIIGGLLLLAAVMEIVGFQIAMSVFLFAELTLLGRQRWWLSAAVAVIGSVGVFVLFDRVLAVQLPLSSIPFLSSLGL